MAAPSLSVLAGLLNGAAASNSEMESQASQAEQPTEAADEMTTIKYSSDHGHAPYEVAYVSISYERWAGLVLMPGSSDEADICQESKPWGTKTVEWAVARLRVPPKIPMIEETDNEVLSYEEVSPATMTIMPDGITPLYYRQGSMVYFFVTPPNLSTDSIKSPKNPALSVDTPAIETADRESMAPSLDD